MPDIQDDGRCGFRKDDQFFPTKFRLNCIRSRQERKSDIALQVVAFLGLATLHRNCLVSGKSL